MGWPRPVASLRRKKPPRLGPLFDKGGPLLSLLLNLEVPHTHIPTGPAVRIRGDGIEGFDDLKRLLIFFLILVAIFSFAVAYHQTQVAAVQKMENAGLEGNWSLWIPDSRLFSGPDSWERVYPLLQGAAEQSQVNVFRPGIGYTTENRPEIIQYVLLTHHTRFYSAFTLKSGRFLTPQDTKQRAVFLSTMDTGNQQQVGTLKGFGSSPIVEIRPLRGAVAYLPFAGQYLVEAPNPQNYETFVNRFAAEVNAQFKADILRPYKLRDFMQANRNITRPLGFGTLGNWLFDYVQEILLLIVTITLVLLVYYSFHAAKRIGIMKMHGVSNIRVWYLIVGRLIVLSFLLLSTIGMATAIVIGGSIGSFPINFFREQCTIYVLVTAASLIVYLYVVRIRVSDAIKNRKHTGSVFAVNTLMKVGWSVFLIFVILGVWSQYATLRAQQALLNGWQKNPKTNDYGVFYPLDVGHNYMGIAQGDLSTQYVETNWLYPILNRNGALWINTEEYRESVLPLPRPTGYIRSIYANPNYLHQFPVYDIHHRQVQISESTSDWILLVPQRYRSRGKEVLEYFHQQRLEAYNADEGQYGVPVRVKYQAIKIIWLTNDQAIFSFDPEVFPKEGNNIVDPIIQVLTTSNTTDVDQLGFISGDEASALKIRLIRDDPRLTMPALRPELKRLHLDSQLRSVAAINQAIAQRIQLLQQQMNVVSVLGLGLLASLLFLVVQNLTILFTKYRQKFLVRRLFGLGFTRVYKEYLLLFAGTWVGQLLICTILAWLIATSGPPGADGGAGMSIAGALTIGVMLLVIELTVSVVALIRIEGRNMAEAVKEGV